MSEPDSVTPATEIYEDPDVARVVGHWWREQVLDGGAR
jgi:hypothetical protein